MSPQWGAFRSSWRPAVLWATTSQRGTSMVEANPMSLSGPPCPCLTLDPSDSNARGWLGHGGKVTQDSLTATTSTFWCKHHPRTSVLGKQPAPPSSSTLPRFFHSESPQKGAWLHPRSTQQEKRPPGASSALKAPACCSSQPLRGKRYGGGIRGRGGSGFFLVYTGRLVIIFRLKKNKRGSYHLEKFEKHGFRLNGQIKV